MDVAHRLDAMSWSDRRQLTRRRRQQRRRNRTVVIATSVDGNGLRVETRVPKPIGSKALRRNCYWSEGQWIVGRIVVIKGRAITHQW